MNNTIRSTPYSVVHFFSLLYCLSEIREIKPIINNKGVKNEYS